MTETRNNHNNDEEFQEHPDVLTLKSKLLEMSKDQMKKETDSFRTEISQLSSKISQLKKKREEHNAQARHYRNMRDNVSGDKFSEVDKLRNEVTHEKELRDECNEKIRINKERREELKNEVRIAWSKVKELREKYYQMKDEVGVLPEEITNEIRRLEWNQQTSSLDPEEDALVTKQISELYEKAYTAHLIGYSSDELEKAIETAKRLSTEHDEAHENVLLYHEEGQKHHQRMQEIYEQLDELRTGGNNLHEKFLEERQAADLAHKNIEELYQRIKLNQYLMDLIDDEQMRRRREKSDQIREEKIQETKKKQTSSKKLTLDELRLLMGEEEEEKEE
ncbi:MAG: hypothetical protein FK731_01115 [Asgard group archaeon]|nr:hypothetical protein [Asgard group archaeon]